MAAGDAQGEGSVKSSLCFYPTFVSHFSLPLLFFLNVRMTCPGHVTVISSSDLLPKLIVLSPLSSDPEGRAHTAVPARPGLQHGQSAGDPVPVADLEEAAPGGLPAGDLELSASAAGLLHRRLAPPRPR